MSQLKFIEDGYAKTKFGGDDYGFLSMQAQHKFKMKSLRTDLERKIGRPGSDASNHMLDLNMTEISEKGKYDEMGTEGNLMESRRTMTGSRRSEVALGLSRRSIVLTRSPPLEPTLTLEVEDINNYKMIQTRTHPDSPNGGGCCGKGSEC